MRVQQDCCVEWIWAANITEIDKGTWWREIVYAKSKTWVQEKRVEKTRVSGEKEATEEDIQWDPLVTNDAKGSPG